MIRQKSVSIIIPTYNSEKVLGRCLKSITEQDYPMDLIEIIIADGGSTDATLEIARRHTDKIYFNALRTGEAGKAVGVKHATGEIVALIDSDNILPSRDWLSRMIAPFADEEIVGAEPLGYTYRREDSYITRYCALMGMNDPLCLFLGNYDRYNHITGKWTEMPVEIEDQGDYLKVTLNERKLPTIGANGFFVRRQELLQCSIEDYLFDIDVVYELVSWGKNKYAKVKIGIVHLFASDLMTFARKQRRRVRDYLYYNEAGLRTYPWQSLDVGGLVRFVASCVLMLPLLVQSLQGYLRRPDRAWLLHPLVCWLTLGIYGLGWIQGQLTQCQPESRLDWNLKT